MLSSRFVVIRNYDDIAALEITGMLAFPFTGAASIAGSNDAESSNIIDILLALEDKDGLTVRYRFKEFRQAIRYVTDPFTIPRPAALSITSTLPKSLWREPDDLKLGSPGLVKVVIDSNDFTTMLSASVPVTIALRPQILPTQGIDDGLLATASVAMEEHLASLL
jgi:hypothetical protein